MSSNSYGYQSISPIGVSHVCATAKAQLGDRKWVKGNEYVYVYNAGGEEIYPGYGVCYSAVSGYSVTVSSVTEVNECAGVVANVTFATADYGWILVNGFVKVEAPASDILAVGDRIQMGTDGVHAPVTTATALVAVNRIHGYMLDATASAGSALAHVKCYS